MFWWAVPVGFTGFLFLAITLLAFLVSTIVINLEDFIEWLNFTRILTKIFMFLIAIGFITMGTGFLFWAIGEIWTPYL